MITKHVGGEVVPSGTYWRRSTGEFLWISPEGGRLTGGPDDWYVRAPLPLVLLLGPLMGLLFFFTLPLSGMLVLAPLLAGKVRTAVSSGRLSPVHLASGAEPGISYLEPHLRPGAHDSTIAARCDGAETGDLIDLANKIAEKEWGEG